MAELLKDTALGAAIRLVTGNRLLRYPEEKESFQLPDCWQRMLDDDNYNAHNSSQDLTNPLSGERSTEADVEKGTKTNQEAEDEKKPRTRRGSSTSRGEGEAADLEEAEIEPIRTTAGAHNELEKTKSIPIAPRRTKDGAILVDWYATDDPDNPYNWSNLRRAGITAIICLYTFIVYTSSAIYTTSVPGVMEEFGVDGTRASLGLALFVLGYGIGPLAFSPLSEIPALGRNPIYIVTMFLFVIVSIPAALPQNYAGLMVLRFLQGLFGSPCLASGAASIGDLYSMNSLPYALMLWTSAAYCGPSLGPLLSGFSVPVMGWRWSLLEILWGASPIFVLMFAFLPETATPTILYRRAARLRRLTGNPRFLSQGEIEQRGLKASAVFWDALIKPLEITIKDPAILFVQIYTAIIYAIYYSFFEVFPLVYPVYYNMGPGQIGLVFLCMLVACIIGVASYSGYLWLYLGPRIEAKGHPVNEARLVPALVASFGPTVGLFLFAWTASPSIHWIVPTIGITIYGAAGFVVMQCIFIYVPLSYPRYAASLFAANDFFRSALAFAAVLFATPLYSNMGIARGTSLLGGLSVIGIVGIFLLYIYGAKLRSMSKFAVSADPE